MAEVYYKNASATWTKIAYADVGAAASNHNHDTAYLKKTGDTATGSLIIKNGTINLATNPSTTQYGGHFGFADTNGTQYAYTESYQSTNGSLTIFMTARRTIDGTSKINNFNVSIDSSGTSAYSMSAPATFRSYLGLGNTTGAVPVANGGTGVTTATGIANIVIKSGTGDPPASGTPGTVYIKYT